MILRIAFDLDGVLCDFIKSIVKILRERVGVDLPPDFQPTDWHWGNANLPKGAMSEAWQIIDADKAFWESLEPLEGIKQMTKFFREESFRSDIYFITARKNGHGPVSAKRQSENWLYRYLDYPIHQITVLPVKTAMAKIPIIAALGIHYFVDDHGLTIAKCQEEYPEVKSYLLARPWNLPDRTGVRVIESLSEFYADVNK